MHVVIIIS